MFTDSYDHFSAYGLTQQGAIAGRLSQLSSNELAQFLAIYKTQAKQCWLAVRATAGDTDIYPDS